MLVQRNTIAAKTDILGSTMASTHWVLKTNSGGKGLRLFYSDIHDWRITFADAWINSNIGQRLKAVEKYLEGEEEFLANYSDGLTDLPLPQQLEHFHQQGKIASFLCARPNLSYLRRLPSHCLGAHSDDIEIGCGV